MSPISVQQDQALRTARFLLDLGHPIEDVLSNQLIPSEFRVWVAERLEDESNKTFERARVISSTEESQDWLVSVDRSEWYYWPTLRSYLLGIKGWSKDTVLSLDDASDRILRELKPPSTTEFDIRGLVLGYVQSGKTANFTAVIAKAADAGYRLVVVFSGIDNGLRRQTQIRLNKELTGYPSNPRGAVRMPPVGRQWHQFTTDELSGDFDAGRANHAALQGSQPVLIVVKKNGAVLRRLQAWFASAPANVRSSLPALFIDDEADQASVDTRGSYQTQAAFNADNPDYEPPAVINGLIRSLVSMFSRRAYVAYTATPFANILIPHDAYDNIAGADLYPKDFFIDLPKPDGYFGTEEFFGRIDSSGNRSLSGIDVLRVISQEDVVSLVNDNILTENIDEAICSFVLGGAARAYRGNGESPSTMLVHTSQRIADQTPTKKLIEDRFRELKDSWRYDRNGGIRARLASLWNEDFVPTSAGILSGNSQSFSDIEPFIGPFMEAVVVREINSETGDVLDFEREPSLKAIAVGGNRLARGLTLEGLLVSVFARRSPQYDTLLQMARWYGYRSGYEDLTRIYTTRELAGWFTDLALVEYRLRQDMQVYEQIPGLKPIDLGMRILQHPAMQVTSPLKRRTASSSIISQSYSLQLEQTFKFPLQDEERLSVLCEENRQATMVFLSRLGRSNGQTKFGPVWGDVSAAEIVAFIRSFAIDFDVSGFSPELIAAWIERQNIEGDLVSWTVAVRGRDDEDENLGRANWLPDGEPNVWNVSRTRIKGTNSLGVITTPGDESIGLTEAEILDMESRIASGEHKDRNRAARFSRSSKKGLLLIYPISKNSGQDKDGLARAREPLYQNPESATARDLIGIALSFPKTKTDGPTEAYLEGSARWRPCL
ncbi:Z1 domain-containing protein [Pseudomonas sp. REP124]|uniref:Z1 domain-containing protein n=1 Tax=Pseudomonas sp. REP124 TaxID=2875731 RepID=UPI001CCC5722|nr:Z1 domain-containing protein [Pseudomonas sp. REP124]MBZ9784273.1 Z1 domain-containing protein [Pseudomonas sp. REP124]